MGDRYPDRIPPALAEVLGMPPHQLHPWWGALREVGVEVPRRYEGEVASALHFLIPFAISHPADWRGAAIAELKRLQAGAIYVPPIITIEASPVPPVHSATADSQETPGTGQQPGPELESSPAPEDSRRSSLPPRAGPGGSSETTSTGPGD